MSIRNPLAIIVNAITMAIGNVNDAPLEFNALAIKDMRLNVPDLQSRIIYHYRQEVLRQLYRILGSADFIGNPVGLFTNVSSGVADIFYEPFNGVVMHGNRELGVGIAKVRCITLYRFSGLNDFTGCGKLRQEDRVRFLRQFHQGHRQHRQGYLCRYTRL